MGRDELLNAIFERVCTIGEQQELVLSKLATMEARYECLDSRLTRVEDEVRRIWDRMPA